MYCISTFYSDIYIELRIFVKLHKTSKFVLHYIFVDVMIRSLIVNKKPQDIPLICQKHTQKNIIFSLSYDVLNLKNIPSEFRWGIFISRSSSELELMKMVLE
jgi:hypothetical protein